MDLIGIFSKYAPFPELSSYAPVGRNLQELTNLRVLSSFGRAVAHTYMMVQLAS